MGRSCVSPPTRTAPRTLFRLLCKPWQSCGSSIPYRATVSLFLRVRATENMHERWPLRRIAATATTPKNEITGHGFRAMARTILHEELGFAPEPIEHQLAHRVPDNLGSAYNRTKFIKERTRMMAAWADYLDKLKAGGKVVAMRGKK